MTRVEKHRGLQYDLHQQFVNPAFVKMLKTIGFDKNYVRGEGCYLWDPDGNKYLDLLTGWGVFMLGRNHPKIRAVLHELLDVASPNLVRMDCSILSGTVQKSGDAAFSKQAGEKRGARSPKRKQRRKRSRKCGGLFHLTPSGKQQRLGTKLL